jgi:hypothetical protein
MTLYFNETNTASIAQRKAAIEACVLASVVDGSKRQHEIHKSVASMPGMDWVRPTATAEAIGRLQHARRLVLVWRDRQSIVAYALPTDSLIPLVRFSLDVRTTEDRKADENAREKAIVESLAWPKWFYVLSEKELLPYTR